MTNSLSRPPVETGNQTARIPAAVSAREKRARALRDVQAVLNLRLLCPDLELMVDALGLSDVAGRVARAEVSLEAQAPVGGGPR